MKKDNKQRLFEVMGKLDETFKPQLNESNKNNIMEQRMNPIFKATLMNDKKFHDTLKYIRTWFTGKIGYIEPRQREYFKDLTIEEIKKMLDNLNVGYGKK